MSRFVPLRPRPSDPPESILRALPPPPDDIESGSTSSSRTVSPLPPLMEAQKVDALVQAAYARHRQSMDDDRAFKAALQEVRQIEGAGPRVRMLSKVHAALRSADAQGQDVYRITLAPADVEAISTSSETSSGTSSSVLSDGEVDAQFLYAFDRHRQSKGDGSAFIAALDEVALRPGCGPRVAALEFHYHEAILAAANKELTDGLYCNIRMFAGGVLVLCAVATTATLAIIFA